MISALRKIEGRGELPGATSAVMELCLDNPREGFSDLFATHPSVASRVQALVKYAGGHDPGPLALPSEAVPDDPSQSSQDGQVQDGQVPPALPSGPWGSPGGPAGVPQGTPPAASPSGPWGSATGPWGRR
jgi:heat shock protein HtpX